MIPAAREALETGVRTQWERLFWLVNPWVCVTECRIPGKEINIPWHETGYFCQVSGLHPIHGHDTVISPDGESPNEGVLNRSSRSLRVYFSPPGQH